MSHEQSTTDQNPISGRYVNRYGPKTERAGERLESVDYESQREAETRAMNRSFNQGERTRAPQRRGNR
jgi:hypothetical protein